MSEEIVLSKETSKVLSDLGLTAVQARVYVVALRLGMPTAMELARTTGLSRQTIYDEVEKLIRLGLFDLTRKQRRKYIPAKPEVLLKLGQRKVNEANTLLAGLSNVIPRLEQQTHQQKSKHAVIVKYYEGIDRVRKAYLDVIDNARGAELLSLSGSLEDIFKFFPFRFWERWNRKLAHNNGSARIMSPSTNPSF